MSGPRILVGVLLLALLALWAALSSGGEQDLERGLDESELAFSTIEAELAALEPSFQALAAQGLVLGLREEHETIRSRLTSLRNRQVAIASDATLDRRQRLPQLRELVNEADEALALAVQLRRKCDGLVALRTRVGPLRQQARELRDAIAARVPADGEAATHAATLASGLAEKEEQLLLAERLLRQNVEQGVAFGNNILAGLQALVEEQQRLLDELD